MYPDSPGLFHSVAIESIVRILPKSPMLMILVVLAASSALFAQSGGSAVPKNPNDASILDGRQIAQMSVEATKRNLVAWDYYTYIERDENRRLDSRGLVESEDSQLSKITLVNGDRFEQLVEHNGHPPSAEEQERSREDLDKLKHETPKERDVRLRKQTENMSLLGDVLDAFDFKLVGEQMVGDRQAYVLKVAPHRGYHANGKYGKLLSKVEGKLWVDKQDFGWIKMDGQVTETFSMGLFIARVQRGSQIHVEETSVDDIWMPGRIEVRGSAKILFLKSLDIDRILTYSNYDRVTDSPYSVSK
jgi:hypothetical protein